MHSPASDPFQSSGTARPARGMIYQYLLGPFSGATHALSNEPSKFRIEFVDLRGDAFTRFRPLPIIWCCTFSVGWCHYGLLRATARFQMSHRSRNSGLSSSTRTVRCIHPLQPLPYRAATWEELGQIRSQYIYRYHPLGTASPSGWLSGKGKTGSVGREGKHTEKRGKEEGGKGERGKWRQLRPYLLARTLPPPLRWA